MIANGYYVSLTREILLYVPPEQLATTEEAKAYLGIS